MAGGQQYYDKVSEDEGSIDLDQPAREPTIVKRWSWNQQSLLIRTIVIACYTILIAAICSAVVEYRHQEDDADAAVAVTTVTVTPAAAVAGPDPATGAEIQKTPNSGLDEIQHCGHNYTQARELGCVYDVMMQLWMPKACYDENLSESFLEAGNWTWWSDVSAGETMSDEQMRKGEHSVAFMLQDYHKHHCVFATEKLVRALRNQWPLIPELVSYDHIIHCRHKTLFRPDGAVRGVRAPTGFTSCAPYDVWKNQLPEDHTSSIDAPAAEAHDG